MDAATFATTFKSQFQSLTNGWNPREIPLFQALSNTINSISTQFSIYEYHGASHQVTFTATPPLLRPNPRCELADLMIVTYRTMPSLSIRVTYFQAKSERACVHTPLCGRTFNFCGNVEQWYLLAEKPQIFGCGTFQPPADLLTGALLDSIGTFGVFYRQNTASPYEMFYSVASNLSPANRLVRYSKLNATFPCYQHNWSHGYAETVVAGCFEWFAHDLASNFIGSPIEPNPSAPDSLWRAKIRLWLQKYLQDTLNESNAPRENPGRRLLALLENLKEQPADLKTPQSIGVKSVVVFNTTGLNDAITYRTTENNKE